MRTRRVLAEEGSPEACYHCVTRVVDRRFALGDPEKEKFVRILRAYEEFCGVEVLTYCVMSNHVHVLVHVPPRPNPEHLPDDAELVRLVRRADLCFPADELEERLRLMRKAGDHAGAEKMRARFLRRMWSLSAFMQAVKQRFSQWLNTRDGREGTLWEGRFKSVLVEGTGRTLATIAAYIDLNPVRAGIVQEPGLYRWSGYGEAMAGRRLARRRLRRVVMGVLVDEVTVQAAGSDAHRCNAHDGLVAQNAHGNNRTKAGSGTKRSNHNDPEDRREIRRVLSAYRMYVFENGIERKAEPCGREGRRGMTAEQVEAVICAGGRLGFFEAMRCRVRHFTDGCVLGCRMFVEGFFEKNRGVFGPRRRNGARELRGVELPWLCTVRELRRRAVMTSGRAG